MAISSEHAVEPLDHQLFHTNKRYKANGPNNRAIARLPPTVTKGLIQMPVLKSAQLPLLMFLCVSLFAGCCATRKSAPPTCCASVAKPASRAVPNEGSTIVTSQFSQIGEYVSTKLITGDDAIGQTGFLTLEETICIAAENSAKANLLESQLIKLNQSPVDGFEKLSLIHI